MDRVPFEFLVPALPLLVGSYYAFVADASTRSKAIEIIPALLIWLLAVGSTIAYGESLSCPAGTAPKGERTPEVSEAWCEVVHEGKAVLHGPYRAWWPNGQLGTEGQYHYGKPVGLWKGWYADGKRQGEESFEDGRRIGGRYWNENGKQTANPPQQPNRSMLPTR